MIKEIVGYTRVSRFVRSDKGFMLLEFLIGMIIFSIALLALAKMAWVVASGNQFAQQMTIAQNIAQSKLEELKAMSFTDQRFSTGEDVMLELKRSWTVQHDLPSQNMKMITVTVTWGTPTRSLVLSTIVAKGDR
ncbi:MAG: hypothetical protein HY731_12720 [Candidatus Tectomicrobia bacterium]|nr:hypothetical protein [Candidatus Tectomicrobia bacterium]